MASSKSSKSSKSSAPATADGIALPTIVRVYGREVKGGWRYTAVSDTGAHFVIRALATRKYLSAALHEAVVATGKTGLASRFAFSESGRAGQPRAKPLAIFAIEHTEANGKGKALAAPRTEAQAAPEQAPRLEQIAERAESAKAKRAGYNLPVPVVEAAPAPKASAKPAPRLKALDKMLGEAFAPAKPALTKAGKRMPAIGRDSRRAGAKPAAPAPKAKPAPKAEAPQGDDKAQLIEQALRILRTTTKEGSVKQIRKPAAGKVKPLPGRKSPTTRDLVAAIAGVGAQMAFRAIQVAKADPKLAQRVIAGKLSLAEAFEQLG